MTNVVLETKRLVKRFGGVCATNNVDLCLTSGSTHALIGPNGAGKTTLVKQLSGEIFPDSGQIFLCGQDVTGMSVDRRATRGVGRSFQITSVLKAFSAVENVMLSIRAHEPGRFNCWKKFSNDIQTREQAIAVLALVGLETKADRMADELGYGELRQLELAMVVSRDPKALLLDEPLAGLGAAESKGIIELIGQLRGKYAIMLIEHDMDAVFALADCITVLVDGGVIASGVPDQIRSDRTVRAAYLG